METQTATRTVEGELLSVGRQLTSWVESTLSSASQSLVGVRMQTGPVATPPEHDAPYVGVELTGISALPPPEHKAAPLAFRAHYALSLCGGDPELLHQVLGELTFAALSQHAWSIDLPSSAVLLELGSGPPLVPRLLLSTVVARARTTPAVRRVLKPIPERPAGAPPLFGAIAPLLGKVVGPGRIAVAGALVQWPSLRLVARTDAHGEFAFSPVPASARVCALTVQAKGGSFHVTVERPADPALRVEIEIAFDAKEG